MTKKYSTEYRVECHFTVASYQELMPAVGGFGIYATIRQSGGEFFIECENMKSNGYKLDALHRDSQFGCGGLIVGRDIDGTLCCFDLSCPNCNQAQYRLTVKGQTATCSNCGMVYGLIDSPTIIDIGKGLHSQPRGLFQYYPIYTGTELHILNTP